MWEIFLPEMGAEEQAKSLDEEEVAIVMEIAEVIERCRKDKLPALRIVPKKKLLEETAKVDKVLSKFKTHCITKINELFYAGAVVVTNRLGKKIDKVAWRKEPMWKRKMQNKIKELRNDLSQLEASKDKDISNFRHWARLERKYIVRVKRLNVANKELKQRITAIAAKVRRYQGQVDSSRKNRLFENNQRQFYKELDQEKKDVTMISLWLKNRNSFGETYGVSLQIIRMQSGYKTCDVKLMLKNRRR